MKKLNSKLLPYLIAVIIAATIGIQVFWNLEQYKTNKQRYINDVQIALDNSIEGYFSEISKTDLIINITYEFKTPITTVATAIEAIRDFNQENDTEKTNNYLNISQQQLVKLNTMVEKLLETAILDSDKLLLTKEKTDLIPLLQNLIQKHELVSPNKKIVFKSSIAALALQVDPFHLENALNNILDNALKYGGDTIEIEINKVLDKVEIRFTDDGKGISKTYSEKIFEKFYRIPTGNRHDVKGFGIGLYYSKKIIEKHGGQVLLQSQPGLTVFKILI
jgi:two-component system phosphate regulon sensor histidine kinase PhoR